MEVGLTVHNFINSCRFCKAGCYVGMSGEYTIKTNSYLFGEIRSIKKGASTFKGDSGNEEFHAEDCP